MARGNYKLAIVTLRKAKWRSILTMFGVIVGVVSVVTTVSLGEGVKRQVLGQINKLGNDLITVRPGNIVSRDRSGNITSVDLTAAYGYGTGSLTEKDLETIRTTPNVKSVSPIALINTPAQQDTITYDQGVVLGVSPEFNSLIGQKVEFGTFFNTGEERRQVAVIGKRVAEQLFRENVPVGLSMNIRGEDFIVRGVMEEFSGSVLGAGTDLNKAILIPFEASKEINNGSAQIAQTLVRPAEASQRDEVIAALDKRLQAQHSGQKDVTVMRQDETLAVTGSLLNILTSLVAGIAAISLLVGGIGIMNIMLVSVTERTHEIGIRKAVGATNRQIRSQFMVEAVVLSTMGGLLGVGLAYLTNFAIRISTNLKPVITWQVVVIALIVSTVTGMLFGIAPAIKAARKDPIEALRHE